MLAVLCWTLFSLMLLMLIPDRWHARRRLHARQLRVWRRDVLSQEPLKSRRTHHRWC
jgi:hypothetical protein